jgi:hypothetical protein
MEKSYPNCKGAHYQTARRQKHWRWLRNI